MKIVGKRETFIEDEPNVFLRYFGVFSRLQYFTLVQFIVTFLFLGWIMSNSSDFIVIFFSRLEYFTLVKFIISCLLFLNNDIYLMNCVVFRLSVIASFDLKYVI